MLGRKRRFEAVVARFGKGRAVTRTAPGPRRTIRNAYAAVTSAF